jgi:Tfp pilus assembly protein PilF
MLGMALLMGQVTNYVESHFVKGASEEFRIGIAERLVITGKAFWFYIGKLLYPQPLTFIYPRWEIHSGSWTEYLPTAALVLLSFTLWLLRRRIGKGPLVAVLHFYVTTSMLILLLVLFMTRYSFVSDHWQYFGCMSLMALAGAGITMFLDRYRSQALKIVCCGGLLLTLGVLTWRQSGKYESAEVLWRATLADNPDTWLGQNNLGAILIQRGDVDEAIGHYRKALEVRPDYADAHNNLGYALLHRREVDEAIAHFHKALEVDPSFVEAENNLGNAFLMKDDAALARHHYDRALAIKPSHVSAHINLGSLLLNGGDLAGTVHHYEIALELKPEFEGAYNNLVTVAWMLATSPDDSIRDGRKAVEFALHADRISGGGDPVTLTALAAAYGEAGRFMEAIATARRALEAANGRNNRELATALSGHIEAYQSSLPIRSGP